MNPRAEHRLAPKHPPVGLELDAIASAVVGGTLLAGGRATVLGTLTGALIIQLLRYTLLANGVPDAAALVVHATETAVPGWHTLHVMGAVEPEGQ